MRDFLALYAFGNLENIGSLNCTDLPNVEVVCHAIIKRNPINNNNNKNVFWVRSCEAQIAKLSTTQIFTWKAYFIIVNKYYQLFSWNDRLTLFIFEKMSTKYPAMMVFP